MNHEILLLQSRNFANWSMNIVINAKKDNYSLFLLIILIIYFISYTFHERKDEFI
jgi:hypothetical protein